MNYQKEKTTPTDPGSGTQPADNGVRDRPLAFADGGIPILQDIVTSAAPGEFDLDDILPERIPEYDPNSRIEDIERVVQRVSESATERIIRKLEPRIRKEVEKAVRSALLGFEEADTNTGETE